MQPEELDRLLAHEGPSIEWKVSDRSDDEILQAVCALANDLPETGQPGYVLVGVANDGTIVGTTTHRATEADMTRLRERRPENQLPFDQRVAPGARIEDLDLARLREDYRCALDMDGDAASFPALEPWLGQREIPRRTSYGWAPTVAGILVYGIDPHRLVAGDRPRGTRSLQPPGAEECRPDLARVATGLGQG